MQIKFVGIMVRDQDAALRFYTSVLGFENRLTKFGVKFRGEPQNPGVITAVMFEDTCGNLINLVQPAA